MGGDNWDWIEGDRAAKRRRLNETAKQLTFGASDEETGTDRDGWR